MPKQPLYPHVPKSRIIKTYPSFDRKGYPLISKPPQTDDVKLRFLPDSPEFIAQTINGTGYRPQLERVVREAIARANRR